MEYILTLDIGGTNPRMAMIGVEDKNNFKIIDIKKVDIKEKSLISPINDFLKEMGDKGITTDTCSISVAGPVINNSCRHPPHAKFSIVAEDIYNGTEIKKLLVINDFTAIGNAVAGIDIEKALSDGGIEKIKDGWINPQGNRAVLGPGTDLGFSYLVNVEDKFIVSPSEGGNCPLSQLEGYDELFSNLRKELGLYQIGSGVLVSGMGIRRFFKFFSKKNLSYDDKEILEVLENEKRGVASVDGAALISKSYFNNSNAKLSMDAFRDYLIVAAQGVALNGLATGGLFIGGGIAGKNPFLFEDSLRIEDLFTNNAVHNELLKKIPIYVLKDYDISFHGCARAAINKFDL